MALRTGVRLGVGVIMHRPLVRLKVLAWQSKSCTPQSPASETQGCQRGLLGGRVARRDDSHQGPRAQPSGKCLPRIWQLNAVSRMWGADSEGNPFFGRPTGNFGWLAQRTREKRFGDGSRDGSRRRAQPPPKMLNFSASADEGGTSARGGMAGQDAAM